MATDTLLPSEDHGYRQSKSWLTVLNSGFGTAFGSHEQVVLFAISDPDCGLTT